MQKPNQTTQFVLKLYPITAGKLSDAFSKERTVLKLVHKNVIKIYEANPNLTLECLPIQNKTSGLLMEHAVRGDLHEFMSSTKKEISEAAVRTLFHQLIDALEYLHSEGYAHMDVKLSNILLTKDFTLKLADFDQICSLQETSTTARGTKGYRAPEVSEGRCKDYTAADVFSAGVVLFLLFGRVPPFEEGNVTQEGGLYQELIKEDNQKFWKVHAKFHKGTVVYSEAFKSLIKKMLASRAEERPTISEIKKSEWYNGATLSKKELYMEMSAL